MNLKNRIFELLILAVFVNILFTSAYTEPEYRVLDPKTHCEEADKKTEVGYYIWNDKTKKSEFIKSEEEVIKLMVKEGFLLIEVASSTSSAFSSQNLKFHTLYFKR